MIVSELFKKRAESYFKEDSEKFIKALNDEPTHGLFLNTSKASKEDILNIIDFSIIDSGFNRNSYYHNEESIGKTKAYELGLIYPQDVESSFFTEFLDSNINPKLIVDLCSAPGGKTIDILNKYPNAFCVCNDVNHKRSAILASNLERLGLDRTIVTCKEVNEVANALEGNADIVVLDAPCSGEGMIRKYPEILDNYSLDNINELVQIQTDLLENAYKLCKRNGLIIYSTCTYAFEEDETQIKNFINKHNDIRIEYIDCKNNHSMLNGTIKLSPLNNTEGQFICILKKTDETDSINLKYLKTVKNGIVDSFIKENLSLDNYYLYKSNDSFYLSIEPLIDMGYGIIRSGIYIGQIVKDRFEPSHQLYRSNSLRKHFKYICNLDDLQYENFVKGQEIKFNFDNHYYLVCYKNISLGYGKLANKILKNKYPKGLRRV